VIFMQPQIRTFEQQVSSATIWRLFSPEDSGEYNRGQATNLDRTTIGSRRELGSGFAFALLEGPS